MNKKIAILLFLSVLLGLAYRTGMDSDKIEESNDINEIHLEGTIDENNILIDFKYTK